MNRINVLRKQKSLGLKKESDRSELVSFVADQFKKLAKKNIRVPITLYHL